MLKRGEFAKYEALGNDYAIVEPARLGFKLTRARVRALCDRHTGIGADGILGLGRSRRADFAMRIWNPDGSEAERSGNGLRMFARFLRDFGYTRKREIAIETKGGVARAELVLRGRQVARVRVAMGRASFRSRDIPMSGPARDAVGEYLAIGPRGLRFTAVSVGNPHCVVFVPKPSAAELLEYGPQIERHPTFPKRTNVQLASVTSRRSIEALVWERGVGATQASGSSACAVAAAAVRNGLVDGRVSVRMPGGSLAIEVAKDFEILMTGPATPVYTGRLL